MAARGRHALWCIRILFMGSMASPARSGNGLYDTMRPVGAHEVMVENARHDRHLWNADDREIEEYLALCGQRIQDLKGDTRFQVHQRVQELRCDVGAGVRSPDLGDCGHDVCSAARALRTAGGAASTTSVKERCVFCDILHQEQEQKQRVIEVRGEYMATCPYAPRVPYETWIAPRNHEAYFERSALKSGAMRDFAALLRRTLFRIRTIADGFHMVLHTSPNTMHRSETLGFWKTIEDDYHWHLEILPIIGNKAKSYTFKEVYYSPVSSETSAGILRERPTE